MVPGTPAGSSSNAVRPQANPAKDNVRPISIQRYLRIMPAIVSAERFVYLALHQARRLARDEAHGPSDVDLLVSIGGAATFGHYMGLTLFLGDLLGHRVDLVLARQALRRQMA
jgi:hypothetical protein